MFFAGVSLSAADVAIPELGIWTARVRLGEDGTLTKGQQGVLELGGLTLQGTVIDGGDFAFVADYLIVGGVGGWRKPVKARPYRTDNGVRLANVAADLAAEVGERVKLAAGVDRALGYAWTRGAGLASDALDLLGAPWYVRPDGVTQLGPRASGTVDAEVTVPSYDPARRTAVVVVDDDDLGALVPGLTITADSLTSGLRIEHVRIVATPEHVFVEVGPQADRALVDAISARVESRMRFRSFFPYRVQEQAGTRLTLHAEPLTRAHGMPDLVALDKAHGLAGAGEVCPKDAVVLVGWQGGDPGAPFVAHYFGAPTKLSIDAAERIDVGASSSAVRVGDTDHKRVAREGDSVRVDPSLSGSPPVPGGGLLYNPVTQTIDVVPPDTPAAVYFSAAITEGSDLLSTK